MLITLRINVNHQYGYIKQSIAQNAKKHMKNTGEKTKKQQSMKSMHLP